MTLLLTHPACLDHVTPPGHPERPDRLRAVAEVLGEDRFKPLTRGFFGVPRNAPRIIIPDDPFGAPADPAPDPFGR